MNSFTTVIYTFKVSKHIIIGQSTNINVFSWLLSFFKLRERESGIQNLGIKENGPKVTYLIFRRGSTGESFFFHGLIDFFLFLILAWRTRVPHVSVLLLSSTRSKMAMVRLPATDPAQKLAFLLFTSAEGKGPPIPFWGPSQLVSLVSGDLGKVTKYQHLFIPSVTHILLLTVTFLTVWYCQFKHKGL